MLTIDNYKLIVVIVRKGLASKVMSSARSAGADGGTVFFGKGVAEKHIYEAILGIEFEPAKEVIMVAVRDDVLSKIMEAIKKSAELEKRGKGIAFVLDLKKCIGIVHVLKCLEQMKEVCNVVKEKKEYHLIVTVVNKGKGPLAVEAAMAAGAEGCTVVNGRGSGINETNKIFGIIIEPEKEIILNVVDKAKTEQVLKNISDKVKINEPGVGIAFVLEVEQVVGM